MYACMYLSLFLCQQDTRKRLDRFAWNFQERCGVTVGRRNSIFGQFGDAQHGDVVCCAFAPQLVYLFGIYLSRIIHDDWIVFVLNCCALWWLRPGEVYALCVLSSFKLLVVLVWIFPFFTAQCTLVHMRGLEIACRPSVCPSVCLSVTLVDCDHTGWKSWKLIARTISPTPSLFVAKRRST